MMPYTRPHTYQQGRPTMRHAHYEQRNPPTVLHEIHPSAWERYNYPRHAPPPATYDYYDNRSIPTYPTTSCESEHSAYACACSHQNIPHQPNIPVANHHPNIPVANTQHSTLYIHHLRDADVLCGRGAPSHHHPGNLYFRTIVGQYQSRYLAARRIDKPDIASHICRLVRERGGRFLKRTKVQGPQGHFGWQEIDEQRAYEKACQALREGAPEMRRKLAAREIAAAALCLDQLASSEDKSLDARGDRISPKSERGSRH